MGGANIAERKALGNANADNRFYLGGMTLMSKRTISAILIALALSACGGSAAPTATTAPTEAPAPTATEEAAAPTEEPSTDPSGAAAEIPAPPQSDPYVKGENEIIDAAIGGMEGEFENQEQQTGLDLEPLTYYLTEEDPQTIVDFYEGEMATYGWGTGQVEDQTFGKVLVYPSASELTTIAMIGVLDLSTVDPSMKQSIIFTTVGRLGSGSMPSTDPTPDTGGSTTDPMPAGDLSDIPAPPSSEEYQSGDDALTDTFMDSFEKGFAGSAGSTAVLGKQAYISTATPEEIKTFYDDELTAAGWTSMPTGADTTGGMAGTQTLTYANMSAGEALVIMTVDRSSMGMGDGILVIIIKAGQ